VPQSPRAHVTPSALQWARESIGFDLEEAAARIKVTPERLEQAESGEWRLTLRQAEAAARLYERPLAALFLPEPPREEPTEAQFRRLPGAPEPPWPRQMRALARRVRERQEAAAELYDLLEEQPPWSSFAIDYSDDAERLATHAREILGIPLHEQKSWRDSSGYRPLREWVDAVEELGVLVMQDGSLRLEEMRGFASTHADVPAIMVNTNDDPRARAFTALHELGHLLRARAGQTPTPATEVWCNDFGSGVLMPGNAFATDFRRPNERHLLDRVDALAFEYGVTPHATAVRTARLNLAAQSDADAVIDQIQERTQPREPGEGGGNYYLTTVARLGPAFIQLVMAAVDRQVVTYPAASGLLGAKVNNFQKLRETAAERGR
jgi:Zn-dependent peptidase ImmA (M78 family)